MCKRPRTKSLVSSGNSQYQYVRMEVGDLEGKEKDRERVKRHQVGEEEGKEMRLVRKMGQDQEKAF